MKSEKVLVDSVNKTEDVIEDFFEEKLNEETKKQVRGALQSDTAKRFGIDQVAKNDSPEAIKEAVRKIGSEASCC